MGKKRLPELPETDRIYVDRTRGGWLASPAVERHVPGRRRAPVVLLLGVLLVALALLLYWLP